MNYSYSFKFLWLGQSLANLADSFYMLAIVTLIYGKTGSAAISAFIPVIRIIAKFISGIISPLFLERFVSSLCSSLHKEARPFRRTC